jgi:hypothetical protein
MTNLKGNLRFNSSGKKNKNCFMCRIKPVVKIVSDIVDIDDPNMLDKIENPKGIMTSCICATPDNKELCNFCLSNSKRKNTRLKINETASYLKFNQSN